MVKETGTAIVGGKMHRAARIFGSFMALTLVSCGEQAPTDPETRAAASTKTASKATPEATNETASDTQQARSLFNNALAAHQADDNVAAVEALKKSLALRPNHPRTLSVLAQVQSLAGDPEDALATLTTLSDLKMAYAILGNENYTALKEDERFLALAAKFEENDKPVMASAVRAKSPEPIPLIESVALDPATGDLFIGSMTQRRIVRLSADRGLEEFIAPGAHGLWSIGGMKIDEKNHTLWVASAATHLTKELSEGELGASGVFAFDLGSGNLIGKWVLQDDQEHWFGDLLVTENGNLLITDSKTPAVYLLDVAADALLPFLESPHFVSLQGLDLTEDGLSLFLADYAAGLFAVDLITKEVTRLTPQAGVVPYGIDGLYRHGQDLIAIQNGVSPQRVVRIEVDLEAGTLPALEVLEQSHPEYLEPTLGQRVGDRLIYVANSGWPLFGGKTPPSLEEIPATVILELPLG
jgi:hypothetical protein